MVICLYRRPVTIQSLLTNLNTVKQTKTALVETNENSKILK